LAADHMMDGLTNRSLNDVTHKIMGELCQITNNASISGLLGWYSV